MSKGSIVVLSLVLAALLPSTADARGRVHHAHGGNTSVTCLTWEARALLNRIRAKFGKVEIVSTCRPGAKIAGTNYPSKHASGRAIDFRVPGHKGQVVRWLIAHHRSVAKHL
jgi:uncharacterized protein YcbK (DUF882 family)